MRLRPEWTRHDDAALYAALRRGELPTLAALSNAFVTARGDEAARAYAHAAVAVDFLERRFGFPALRDALAAFGRGEAKPRRPAQAVRECRRTRSNASSAPSSRAASRVTTGQYLPPLPCAPATPQRRARPAASRDWVARGLGALQAGDADEARRALERARAVPQPSADDQADTLFLAGEIALARRDADAAVAAFEGLLDSATAARRIRRFAFGWRWPRSTASAPPPPRRTSGAPSSWIRRASSRTRFSPSSTRTSSGPPMLLAELDAAAAPRSADRPGRQGSRAGRGEGRPLGARHRAGADRDLHRSRRTPICTRRSAGR